MKPFPSVSAPQNQTRAASDQPEQPLWIAAQSNPWAMAVLDPTLLARFTVSPCPPCRQ